MSMVKLADVCRIRYGKDHKRLESGDVPVFGSGGVMRYVAEKIYDGPSVLIPRKGTLGNLFFSEGPFWTVDTLFWTEINESRVLPRYLYYALKNRDLASLNIGTAVPSLSVDVLNEVELRLPGMAEQATVTCLLGSLDAKVSLNNQINGYLEELLLTRYDDFFGPFDSSTCDGKLADIGEVIGGATPSKKRADYYSRDGIGWITPRDLSNTNNKFITHGANDITQAGYDSCSARLLCKGSVLFSSRAPIGYVAIADDELVTNQGFKSVVPKPEVGTAFVYCFLKRNARRIADMGAGTTFPEVSGKMMKAVELKLPELETCELFSAFANPLLCMQRKCEAENAELESLRDALLPKLMSGEIDVSKVNLTQLNSHLSGC